MHVLSVMNPPKPCKQQKAISVVCWHSPKLYYKSVNGVHKAPKQYKFTRVEHDRIGHLPEFI